MKENISQRKLLEVLTHEIEVLRKTSKNINEVAPLVAEQVKQLKQTPLTATIDTHLLDKTIEMHKKHIKRYSLIPNWFLVISSIIFCIVTIQSFWLYFKVFSG